MEVGYLMVDRYLMEEATAPHARSDTPCKVGYPTRLPRIEGVLCNFRNGYRKVVLASPLELGDTS